MRTRQTQNKQSAKIIIALIVVLALAWSSLQILAACTKWEKSVKKGGTTYLEEVHCFRSTIGNNVCSPDPSFPLTGSCRVWTQEDPYTYSKCEKVDDYFYTGGCADFGALEDRQYRNGTCGGGWTPVNAPAPLPCACLNLQALQVLDDVACAADCTP